MYLSNLDFNDPTSRTIYQKLSEKIEQTFELMHFALIKISSLGITIPTITFAYVNFYVIGLNAKESFHLPGPMMFPFDWHTPFGYFVAAFVQTVSALCTNTLLTWIACPALGFSWLITSLMENITNDLAHLKVGKLSDPKNRRKLRQHFCRVVKLHSDVKQLSKINLMGDKDNKFLNAYALIVDYIDSW